MTSFKRIGVIASAESLQKLIPYLRECGYDVRAIWCDATGNAVQIAGDLEVPFVASQPSEVILRKDVEMVIVSDYPVIHSKVTINALGIGKHVITNSPVLPAMDVLDKLQDASNYYPQLVSLIGYGFRQLDVFQEMQSRIGLGAIGELCAVEVKLHCGPLQRGGFNWRCDPSCGGGALNILGTQLVDLVRFLAGREVVSAFGRIKTTHAARLTCAPLPEIYRYDSDDIVSMALDLEKGITVDIIINTVVPETFQFHVIATGSKGQLRMVREHLYLTQLSSDHDPPHPQKHLMESTMLKMHHADATTQHIMQLLETSFFRIVKAVLSDSSRAKLATLHDMLAALRVAEAVRRSAANGSSVAIDEI